MPRSSATSSADRMIAPAPSPNRTQVVRSSQSRMRLNVSLPITSACFAAPVRSIESATDRSEEHTSELQSLMRISYAVFCLKKNKQKQKQSQNHKQESQYRNTHRY